MKKTKTFGIVEYIFAAALCALILTGASGIWTRAAVADRVVRLHVVANSDSKTDQAVKLQVRDAVLTLTQNICSGACDSSEALERINANLQIIEDAANAVLHEKGFNYTAAASVEESRFPTKKYEGFSLPAGTYMSLTLRLGTAQGQNWWCVVFPSLCTTARFEEAAQAAGLNENQMEFIRSGDIEIRFRIVEIIERLSLYFKRG